MKQIKNLKKHRWFIWAVVVSFAGLGFLATYVYSTAIKDEAKVPVIIKPAPNAVESNVKAKLPVTQSQATTLVKNIPEVQQYVKAHPKTRVVPDEKITPDIGQSSYWPVQVFEDFNDRTKIYGWFYVYIDSGTIIKK